MFTSIKKINHRWVILGIFMVCLLPVIFSYYQFYFGKRTNEVHSKGVLLKNQHIKTKLLTTLSDIEKKTPTNQYLKVENAQKWSAIIVNEGPCLEACQKAFYLTHQMIVSLGEMQQRVQKIQWINPDMGLVAGWQDSQLQKNGWVSHVSEQKLKQGVYYADAQGNLVLFYPLPQTVEQAKDLRSDFVRLLKYTR
jgi:hypothetical protein